MRELFTENYALPATGFTERLQEGERLLWEGRPNPVLFNRPRIIAYSLIFLPLMPVFVWAVSHKLGAGLPLLSPLTLEIALGLGPVACWLMSKYVAEQTPWAAYALTDRRIFIRRLQRLTSQDSRPKVDEYPLQMLRPRLRQRGVVGTVTFGFPISQYEQAFREIAEADTVFALIVEARTAQLPAESDVPYYLKKINTPVPPLGVEAHLQRGETLLWEGRMESGLTGAVSPRRSSCCTC